MHAINVSSETFVDARADKLSSYLAILFPNLSFFRNSKLLFAGHFTEDNGVLTVWHEYGI